MTEDDLTFKIEIKKDNRLPPGIGIMGKIKEFPEGAPIIEGVILNFGEEDRPLTYKGKVIGKIKEIEYNLTLSHFLFTSTVKYNFSPINLV